MRIKQVVCASGMSGYIHRDLMAIKAGAKQDGFIYRGDPVSPGFSRIVEPATIISIMLVLEDGHVAFGDCADVILAGVAGRDTVFHAADHLHYIEDVIAKSLAGRDVSTFRSHAEEIDHATRDGKPLHMAIRYGATQALLHATALARKLTMAEVIASEYASTLASASIPILASCQRDNWQQLDRMILKRAALLPHASFQVVADHVGLEGEKLIAYASRVAARIKDIGDADYHPQIHLDIYGTLGELFGMKLEPLADYLGRLHDAAAPYALLVESPIIAATRDEQIEKFCALREALRRKGIPVGLIADEWCNTLEDIKLFADAGAADFVQIKTPDLGGINNSIEAVLYCKRNNMGASLGGTANETDQSARITAHIGIACQPDFMLSKPGMGGDEALMILTNEMKRTLALVQARHH